MAVTVTGVDEGSIAERHRIEAGDKIVSINGHLIGDVLDYRFYMTDSLLQIGLACQNGRERKVRVRKEEYEDLGLQFETYLMDRKHTCKNKCIFCFVDQTPKGMRETLYFKDDDERLSFLFGNYVTLTNMSLEEIERIIRMRISPINVSVHTMNPSLRVKMMKNPNAGNVLSYLPKLAAGGIKLNTQLVLCPGINDGDELRRSIEELGALFPQLESIAVVPVGLTRYREGLPELSPYTREGAREVIATVHEYGERWLRERGDRLVYPADEFFLAAGYELPPYEYYGEFPQLDNGVGLLPLLEHEFFEALENPPSLARERAVSIATGEAAYPLIAALAAAAQEKVAGLRVHVHKVVNDFFGHTVTVAGLLTGQDLMRQLGGKALGEELLLPQVMLRHEQDRFLDDVTVGQLEEALGVPVRTVPNDGYELLDALILAREG